MSDSAARARQTVEDKKKRIAEIKAKRAAKLAAESGGHAASSATKSAVRTSASAVRTPSVDDLLGSTASIIGSATNVNMVSTEPIEVVTIMPQEKHVYEIGCQTEGAKLTGKAADMEAELHAQLTDLRQKEQKLNTLQEQLKMDKLKYDALREEERLKEPVELTPDEVKRITDSESFTKFFSRASTMMERALASSTYDFTMDYNAEDGVVQEESKLTLVRTFKDKVTGGRPVTSLSWSPKYQELLLASYAGQDDPMSFDPDGLCRVWNMHMPSRPEYTFLCSSAVLSAQFHPTNSSLIIGACQSGQVVIWDTREKNEYPVNRTSLSNGHTHPIFALSSLPVVNQLHNIMSASTDGQLCVWQDGNLHNPSTEVRMSHGKEEITTTNLDFPLRDANTVVMGSDEGYLYKAHVYDKPGIFEAVKAHDAPISAVRFNKFKVNNTLSDLYLTSSYDWTVKLWSMRSPDPLYTFESARDYVFDAQWSPVHPSLFAMGDGSGRVDIWNIARDSEAPVYSTTLSDTAFGSSEPAAVSRVLWSDNGTHLAVGTSSGAVALYSVQQELAQPSADDASAIYEKMNSKLISLTA